MVGATSAPVQLGKETTSTSFAIQPPTGPALLRADGRPRRVFLDIQNITSDQMAPSYDVYLNVPQGDRPETHPELHVGGMAMFGLVESSMGNRQHPDNGLTYRFEVTSVCAILAASGDWDPQNLRVSFVPTRWNDPVDVRVGRVSLYYE
jgi:tyrosinase